MTYHLGRQSGAVHGLYIDLYAGLQISNITHDWYILKTLNEADADKARDYLRMSLENKRDALKLLKDMTKKEDLQHRLEQAIKRTDSVLVPKSSTGSAE